MERLKHKALSLDFFHRELCNKAVNLAHMFIAQKVRSGDRVVDATMGNGYDTLFLSRVVGPKGRVFSFDIQEQALKNTRSRLQENQASDNVQLIQDGHQNMDHYIQGKIKLVLFNLGYLPQSDRKVTTSHETSLMAIQKSTRLLQSYGLVLVVMYPGHPEGLLEKQTIIEYASHLSQARYNVFFLDFLNQRHNPPVLLGIEKQSD